MEVTAKAAPDLKRGQRMMKAVRLSFIALLAASMCLFFGGCSLAVWARAWHEHIDRQN